MLTRFTIDSILSSKELRGELFTGNYPQELKEKVAARYLEEWIIRNALSRKKNMCYGRDPDKMEHGFYFYRRSCYFYWFGKPHGYFFHDNESYPDFFFWYNVGNFHGPTLSTGKNDVFEYVYYEYEDGNVIYEQIVGRRDRDDYLNKKIKTYQSPSWLIRETSKLIMGYTYSAASIIFRYG